MFTVLLITSALIVGYFARPRDKQSYQMAILAIFGIAYFCIWHFTDFYFKEISLKTVDKNVVFLVLVGTTIILSLLPWVRNTKRPFAIVLVALFGLCVLVTFSLETTIKNLVSGWGGYFGDHLMTAPDSKPSSTSRPYEDEAGGFIVHIPESWQIKKNKLGMTYFQLQKQGIDIAEFRPGCFHDTELSVAEITNNLVQLDTSRGMHAEKSCEEGKRYICLVRSSGSGSLRKKEKWRWLVMDKQQHQNIELDFIFYDETDDSRKDAKEIIHSLKLQTIPDPSPQCISSIDWF